MLIAVFSVIIIGAGYVFGRASGDVYAGTIFALLISMTMTLWSYFLGDKMALWTSGARPVTREENAYVHRMVENLAISVGLPKPKVYLINDPAINAFATGRDPAHASIAVTTGAIQKLENEELEGVLAHELSHIKNYDIRVMTIVVILVGAVAILARMFLHGMHFGGRRSGNDRGGGGALLVLGIVFAILLPLIAELIKLAVSRKREYLADASGALITRYPEGLARALEKINAENRPVDRASEATAHLYFANPFGRKKLAAMFSTHPPIEERVKILRSMT